MDILLFLLISAMHHFQKEVLARDYLSGQITGDTEIIIKHGSATKYKGENPLARWDDSLYIVDEGTTYSGCYNGKMIETKELTIILHGFIKTPLLRASMYVIYSDQGGGRKISWAFINIVPAQ